MEEGGVQCVTVEAPQLRHRQPERGPGAGVLLRQGQCADRPIVRAQRRRHAGTHDARQRVVGEGRAEVRLEVAGRTQIERDAARAELIHQDGVVARRRTMRDARRPHLERTPDLGGAAPLAGVHRDAQTGSARDGERVGVEERVRVGGFRPGQVEADQPAGHRVGGGPCDRDVERLGRGNAERPR